jgi:hypothetical protein
MATRELLCLISAISNGCKDFVGEHAGFWISTEELWVTALSEFAEYLHVKGHKFHSLAY